MASLRKALVVAMAILTAPVAEGAATWGVDLGASMLSIDASTYADNGANGFRPDLGAVWAEDDPPVETNFASNFIIGPDTFNLGAAVNPIARDGGLTIGYITSASAVGVITIDGLGSRTLEIRWRVNTLNDQIGGDGFLSDSAVDLLATISATINGVGPGTPLQLNYDWDYFATAVEDHEDPSLEDPEFASGHVGFFDEQGFGPGNLFATIVADSTDFNNGSGTHTMTTSNPNSFLTIDLAGRSTARMDSPGNGPPFDEDFAGSEFIGRLTITIVPEPTSLLMVAFGAAAIGVAGVRRRR